MIRSFLLLGCLFFSIILPVSAASTDPFVVEDIRLDGLQRVSAGTLFQAFPISIGDRIDSTTIVAATQRLFKTGFFDDIQIGRDGSVLVVTVAERPSISGIEIDGNKAIKTEDLLEGLKGSGLSEGEIFKRATLEGLKQELSRQYISQGRYGVEVETDVEIQPRNRVSLSINITEGAPSKIKQITIVGNTIYSDKDLLDLFELRPTNRLLFWRSDDKYSREKLSGDLERLSSEYMDNGYINFNIESTQVSITPDKESVYITVNIVEGQRFKIGEISFSGDLVIPELLLKRFLYFREGQIFSNQKLTSTTEAITNRLGNEGYTFANVNAIPEINEEDNTVDITVAVDPGKRAYVRRVTFQGNSKTIDEVLRREMRQMESAWASNQNIEHSKLRLQRLGFFKEVNVETPQVAGSDDQIDVEYSVEEQPSGSISASLGYAQSSGLILGAGISQNNFMGTGKRVSFGASRSDFRESYNVGYLNPYYTVDGVQRGFNVFFRKLNFDEDDVSSFITDSYGAGVTFGYPISETQNISVNFNYENTDLTAGFLAVEEISEFVANEGSVYDEFIATFSWRQSRLNRGVFATRGSQQSLALEVAVPGSDLGYYKLSYNGQVYFPLTRLFTLRVRTELGYGDAYGDTSSLPFYKHYFAGGIDSIRGFKNNTLGPRSTPKICDGVNDDGPGSGCRSDLFVNDPDPFGGNTLISGSLELIFPMPFLEDTRSVQTMLFVDAGNVFNTECPSVSDNCSDFDVSEIRYSVGLGASWLSGFGPLTFSISEAFGAEGFEETESFQFSFGKTF